MTRLFALSALLLQLALTCSASPVETEPGLGSFIDANRRQADSAFQPLSLGRRTRSPRHLRVDELDSGPQPPDNGGITDFGKADPQPERGGAGASFFHESNHAIDKQNVDNVSPPTTDAGTVPNLKWSFSLSHTRLLKGGWVREQAITDLPPCS